MRVLINLPEPRRIVACRRYSGIKAEHELRAIDIGGWRGVIGVGPQILKSGAPGTQNREIEITWSDLTPAELDAAMRGVVEAMDREKAAIEEIGAALLRAIAAARGAIDA